MAIARTPQGEAVLCILGPTSSGRQGLGPILDHKPELYTLDGNSLSGKHAENR
jgi:hypothetical protein